MLLQGSGLLAGIAIGVIAYVSAFSFWGSTQMILFSVGGFAITSGLCSALGLALLGAVVVALGVSSGCDYLNQSYDSLLTIKCCRSQWLKCDGKENADSPKPSIQYDDQCDKKPNISCAIGSNTSSLK